MDERQFELGQSPRLCDFIRTRQDTIIHAWTEEIRRLSPARQLPDAALVDHMPRLLGRIAAMVDAHTGMEAQLSDGPRIHAVDRLSQGFDLENVVSEYSLLRRCILDLWEREIGPTLVLADLRRLDMALDQSMVESAARYARGRERMLKALDRISEAALGSEDLDAFLHQLLQATLETTEVADSVAVLLREGDVLKMRAAVGQEQDVERGFTLRIGEGFAGRVAAEAKPLLLRSAATDPLVLSQVLRQRGTKALYGVPLMSAGDVIGVAKLGSRTAYELSEEDKLLFRTMANRAASVIVQAGLVAERRRAEEESAHLFHKEREARTEAERALALLATIFDASPVGIAFIDRELRYAHINDALAAMNGASADAHLGRRVSDVLPPEVAPFVEKLLEEVIATRQPLRNFELDTPSAPDQLRSFLANYFPVLSPQGEVLGVGGVVVEITERKRMESALRESEARFRALADNIPQLAWMADDQGRIRWYNQRWHEYTGTTPGQMLASGWRELHHPDDVQRVTERLRHRFASGEAWEDTFRLRGADGRYRWFLSRAIPLREEGGKLVRWFGTHTDVTEARFLKDASALLASSLDFRQTLASIAKIAVPVLADWCAVEVVTGDGRTEQLAVEHVDKHKTELAHELRRRFPPDPDAPHGVPHVLRTGEPEVYERISEDVILQAAKSPEHLEILLELGLKSAMLVPMLAHGRCVGVISFISAESARAYTPHDLDVAQELAARAALALDNARLLREAHDAVRAREEILAVVSHDLRNPLGVINMSASMLLGKVTEPRPRKHLEMIQRSVGRMEHLIGDLLDMANVQAGHLAIDKELHDAESLAAEAFELHEALAAEEGIELQQMFDASGSQLLCDRERVLQAFSNLIGNAIKFCSQGDRITIRAEREDGHVRFSVSDSGPGIPESELPRIFEPYWSGQRHAKKGTGLGLFITKGIIDAHGGRIWAESKPGAGCAFHFTLPIADAA